MTPSSAVFFHGPDRPLELRRLERPRPRGGEVLVRVLGCTLCGSDLHTIDGRRDTPVPTILGHEIVGEIASFGDDAPAQDVADRPLQIGDRVTWSIVASCGDCFFCRRDLPQKCLAAVKYGHERCENDRDLFGGLAEHCILAPGTAIVRLPVDLPDSVACPANCATATVAAALRAAGDLRERNVCVFGVGLLGLTAAAMLRVAGAAHIVCVDVNEDRVRRALRFGATHAVTPDELAGVAGGITKTYGFDIVFELSGSPAAFENGWPLLRLGGTVVLVGAVFPAPPVSVSLEQIVRRNLTIRGVHNYAPRDLSQAVSFLAENHCGFPFADLVTDWFPLESAAEAVELSHDPSRIRVGIRPAPSMTP